MSEAAPRYHALDGLRAAMMLLGIYLHVACAYTPLGPWPYKQAELTHALDLTIIWIHVFRMPVFYVMAGFFAALLYQRYGFRRAADNRIRRILVPFVVAWLIVFPLAILAIWTGKGSLAAIEQTLPPGPLLLKLHPMHLWFLEYLLLLYLLAVIAVPAIARLPQGLRAAFDRALRGAVERPWGMLGLAVPSTVALLPMRYAGLDDPPNFVPAPHILLAYAIPFAVGWWLYGHADLLAVLRRRAWFHALAAAVASVAYLALLFSVPARGAWFVAQCAAHSIAMWCLVFGITGLFLRYLAEYRPRWRYLCDASYFLYLAHLPVVLALQLVVEPLPIPPLAKVPVVLAATLAILLLMYRYGVRSTAIGATLNGRRYPGGPVPAAIPRPHDAAATLTARSESR